MVWKGVLECKYNIYYDLCSTDNDKNDSSARAKHIYLCSSYNAQWLCGTQFTIYYGFYFLFSGSCCVSSIFYDRNKARTIFCMKQPHVEHDFIQILSITYFCQKTMTVESLLGVIHFKPIESPMCCCSFVWSYSEQNIWCFLHYSIGILWYRCLNLGGIYMFRI